MHEFSYPLLNGFALQLPVSVVVDEAPDFINTEFVACTNAPSTLYLINFDTTTDVINV